DVRKGVFRYSRMEHSEMTVRIYGTTAVVVGRTTNEGHRGDRDVGGDFRYTRIYVKRDGHWQAVAGQYTRIAASSKKCHATQQGARANAYICHVSCCAGAAPAVVVAHL